MIKDQSFWQSIFQITKEENIDIIQNQLSGPADILEAQLQPIIWHCLKKHNTTATGQCWVTA